MPECPFDKWPDRNIAGIIVEEKDKVTLSSDTRAEMERRTRKNMMTGRRRSETSTAEA